MPASCEQFMKQAQVVGVPTTCTRIELARETLSRFGRLRIRATGGSMLPAIAPGDLLEFRACSADDAAPGQVLLVWHDQRLVAHRLVARQVDALVTRGDALAATDAPVLASNVLGVLVQQQRGGQTLHTGGRHWLHRQRAARWLIRRVSLAHRLFCRIPVLAALTA